MRTKKKYMHKYAIDSSDKRIILGCVYEPDVFDTDDAYADAEAIEKGCYEFNLDRGVCGVMHKETTSSVVMLESYIAPCKLDIEGQIFKRGAWMFKVRVDDDELWKQVKSGEFNGFSMGGWAEFGEE